MFALWALSVSALNSEYRSEINEAQKAECFLNNFLVSCLALMFF